LAFGIVASRCSTTVAEEPPHLELARGLIAQGMPDLAVQYLEKLSQKPPANLAAALPLELAKARLEWAAQIAEPGRRLALQNEARAGFETFAKGNPQSPLAAEASLEIARIAGFQGKTLLGQANHRESKEAQQAERGRARTLFEDAAGQLATARAQIDARLKAAMQPGDKDLLSHAQLQAEFEQGINLLNQAETYTEQADFTKRGDLLKKAMETLDAVAKRNPKDPICWEALAWLGRCQSENDDPKAARKIFMNVIDERESAADSGRRLARYFRMGALARDVNVKNALTLVVQAGEEWLRLYPGSIDTPQGLGVRFELANAYNEMAQKAGKNSVRSRELFDKARKLYQGLEASENEYAAEAHTNRQRIILAVSQTRTRGDIDKLKDFEECYLRAQAEAALLSEETKAGSSEPLEKQRERHFKNILEALRRGLDLAQGDAPADEVEDARSLLTYAYLANRNYYSAAVVGEDLARTHPRSPRAPLAGAYALRAYGLVIARQQEDGASREDLEPVEGRLRRLAQYIEQTWPTHAAGDSARDMQARLLLTEKDYPAAVDVLERITPGYPEATHVYYQLAAAALQAEKDGSKPAIGKRSYRDRALAALTKIPELSATADAAAIRDYFGAKLLQGNIYYLTKQFALMQTLADALQKRLDALTDDRAKAEQRLTVRSLDLSAKLGQAEADAAVGQYAKARALLDPLVAQLKDPARADQFADLKEKRPELVRAVLASALRANVQDSKLDQGKAILDLLQQKFPENSQEIMVEFIQQLQEQIHQLRQQGEAAKPQLEKTVGNFSAFLEELAKQQEMTPRPDILLFLSQSYASLDNHVRAAELANKVEEPRPASGKAEVDPKQMQQYERARLVFVRELRLSKDFDKAAAALSAIQSTPWGAHELRVRKEGVLLLEDQDKLAGNDGAILAWDKLMRQMKPRIQDNGVKEQYFDCYYHFTLCLYKYAEQLPDVAKRAKYRQKVASYIAKLDAVQDAAADDCKKRFKELLEKDPTLKEQSEALMKNAQ
jgi:TolA-binding protein